MGVKGIYVQVIIWPKHVRRYRRGEVVPKFLLVRTTLSISIICTYLTSQEYALILHVYQTFGVSIPKIALVRRSDVDLGLVERVGDLIGEDTRRETGYDLLSLMLMCAF